MSGPSSRALPVGHVALITGPMGSGKSTLARHLAQRLDWECVSEDTYWVENAWGTGLREPEHERAIQRQVVDRLLTLCRSGRGVVLEFILYSEPPNPLSAYERALATSSIPYNVIVLKPSVAEIMRRIENRGRSGDLERLEERARDVEHQVTILDSEAGRHRLVLDSSDLSIEEVSNTCLKLLGRPPS